MPRKPTEIVQVNLRLREALRRRLEQAAGKRNVSLNYEMTSRLERSLEKESVREIDLVAADIAINWARFGQVFHELSKQGDLIRAAEALVALIDQDAPLDAIRAAVAPVKVAVKVIEIEAAMVVRGMHTAGVGLGGVDGNITAAHAAI